ncbi:MAG: hypothetical protein ABIR30_11780 [Chitinophagaceae bacterium]
MPVCLPTFPLIQKKYRLFALLLISPLLFHAQTLTGLWTGALSNDSNTVRKDQSFEIALTEYRGKVYGYSRSEFIVDDTLYYVVKRVKGTIEGDVCEVIDDEIIAYNFRGKLDKGIKVTSTFKRNQSDSSWYLAGTWKTNATKKYYSVTGKVDLEVEKDLTASKIFPHLEELKLANDVAFYKERKEGQPVVKIAKPEKIKPVFADKAQQVSLNTDVNVKTAAPVLERAEAAEAIVAVKKTDISLPKTATKDIPGASVDIKPAAALIIVAQNKLPETNEEVVAVIRPDASIPKTETKHIPEASVNITPAVSSKTLVKNNVPQTIPATAVTQNKPAAQPMGTAKQPDTKPIPKNTVPITTNNPVKTGTEIKKQEIALNTAPKTNPAGTVTNAEKKEVAVVPVVAKATPEIKRPEVDVTSKVAVISGRKSEFTQVVNFKSDSLVLSLYDNGEIDGDTVSVFLNGEVLMAHQGLKASAIKKTIYITPGNEDFSLVLFAENLGKYPPNTGLLVVRDGEDIYNLRFSSDFQKNAGIVFRKKN